MFDFVQKHMQTFRGAIFRIINALQVIFYKLSSTSTRLGNMYHNGAWIVLCPILGVTIPLMLSIGARRIIERYK